MKTRILVVACVAALALVAPVKADVDFKVDQYNGYDPTWVSFVNIFDLADAPQFGFGWGPDIWKNPATWGPGTLTLESNVQLWHENATDPFWFDQGTGLANLKAEFNTYQEVWDLNGENVTFTGDVLSNTMAAEGYQTTAFIKVLDPGQGWATTQIVTQDLIGGQPLNLSLTVDGNIGETGLVTQAGFAVYGTYVDPASQAAQGSVVLGAIPEPASLALLGMGSLMLLRRRRV